MLGQIAPISSTQPRSLRATKSLEQMRANRHVLCVATQGHRAAHEEDLSGILDSSYSSYRLLSRSRHTLLITFILQSVLQSTSAQHPNAHQHTSRLLSSNYIIRVGRKDVVAWRRRIIVGEPTTACSEFNGHEKAQNDILPRGR